MESLDAKEKLLLMLISAHHKGIVQNAAINASLYPQTKSNFSLLVDEGYVEEGGQCEYKEDPLASNMPVQYRISCILTDKAMNYLNLK